MKTIPQLVVESAVNPTAQLLTYDLFKVTGHSSALRTAGAALAAKLPANVSVLIAPGLGAAALAAAVALAADRDLVTLTVRDREKARPTERLVEGPKLPQEPIYAAFVDDIISNGKTFYKTIETLKSIYPHVEVVCCLLLLDGWSFESRVRTASGVQVHSYMRRHDINLTRDEDSFARQHKRTHLLTKKLLEVRIGMLNADRKKSSPLILPDRIITADDLHMVRATAFDGSSMWAWSSRHMRGDKGVVQDLRLQPDGTLVVAGYSGAVARLTTDGKALWEYKITHAIHSTPVVDADGHIYVNCEEFDAVKQQPGGSIVRLSPDGHEIQKFHYSNEFAPTTCALYADTVIVTANDGIVRALLKDDLATVKWETKLRGLSRGAITVDGNTIYFGDEAGFIYALDAQFGEILWSTKAAIRFMGQTVMGFDDSVVICDSVQNAQAFYKATGARKWITRFRSPVPHHPIKVTPQRWIFTGRDGDVSLVDVADGTKIAHSRTRVQVRQSGAYFENKYAQLTADGILQMWETNHEICR